MTSAALERDEPERALAALLASDWGGAPVRALERFPTGLAHFVFDVELASSARVVVRLARAGPRDAFAGALYWSRELRPRGVPLPELYGAGERDGVPYLLLARLPGRDLGEVYGELSPAGRRALAHRIADLQAIVGALPPGRGFGYVPTPDGPFQFASWRALVEAALARARKRLAAAGVIPGDPVARVEAALERCAPYLDEILAQPFLDDTTTKNVIVHQGRLSGIVDVDVVCYGDPLFPVALTRTALENAGQDPDYIEYWCERLLLSTEARRALCLYTAVFCVDLLSELGHRFNRAEPIAPDPARVARLQALLARELARVEAP